MTSRTPPLLEPYLPPILDETALVIVTGVIGASTNWLVLRQLQSLLLKPKPPAAAPSQAAAAAAVTAGAGNDEDQNKEVAVLLVSFLRDFAFWRENLARLGGVDLEAQGRRGRFGYVDGLSLFSSGLGPGPGPGSGSGSGSEVGGGGGGAAGWKRSLRTARSATVVGDIRRVVVEVAELLKKGKGSSSDGGGERGRKVVLVVDGLDFVLASSPGSAASDAGQGDSPSAAAVAVKDMLMDLREQTHAAIVTLAADDPLIKEQETTLEKNHAWLALSLAHEADTVLSLRLLDTGTAKDVSGVIRITHGGGNLDTKDHEYLYHVGGDGGVRVFERGQ
ncbi:DNA recombination and repair protein Rad51-like C-terminal domain-containing protein [Madurella fahalii]|uniref:DNA recombination and repair protein Rad51-like C-terminal domain-containing protein n=1 Tax=Madurella fahalii TaxID=1157608 RepID=A0ABQ0G2W9_9PEZI